MKCDFAGWATKNDLLCTDGRTIRRNAFKDCDGITVPLVYQHDHSDPTNVLGHCLLENRKDGVYCYGFFNNTEKGQHAKESVKNGDITRLSIYANHLKQQAGDVIHGMIREVSLVMTGANPGAQIETVLGHAEEFDEEAVITTGEEITTDMAKDSMMHSDESIDEIFDGLSDKQKEAVYTVVGLAMEDEDDSDDDEDEEYDEDDIDDEDYDEDDIDDEEYEEDDADYDDEGYDEDGDYDDEATHYDEGDNDMKYNAFEGDDYRDDTISHSDMEVILADAKRCGSLREAVLAHMEDEDGVLSHIDTTGMEVSEDIQNYGVNDPSFLFPEYKSLNNPPEWIKRNTGWVTKVMGSVGHTPFSRVKTQFADITEDAARAKGYLKGNLKKEEVFSLLKRTTDPQTIYKKQKMDRDDIIDITDFDVVRWIKSEMRLMLDEEIARAILIGDGRLPSDNDKISEDHIRPVVTDKPLFNTKISVTVPANATGSDIAEEFIDSAIRGRKHYKGSGNPTLFTTEDMLTELLLLKDGIGHKLYKTEAELATTLRVSSIVTVEPMEGMQVDNKDLLGVIVNLSDYKIGADKGGAVEMFDDFDIDYNQFKYLIETRCSGALVKPYSALTLLKTVGA